MKRLVNTSVVGIHFCDNKFDCSCFGIPVEEEDTHDDIEENDTEEDDFGEETNFSSGRN